MKIYCVYVCAIPSWEKTVGSRVWGWFSTFEKAEDIILNNRADVFECSYDYACVEEVKEGFVSAHKVMQWYKAVYKDGLPPVISKCDTPEDFKNTVNFSMG